MVNIDNNAIAPSFTDADLELLHIAEDKVEDGGVIFWKKGENKAQLYRASIRQEI